MAPAVVPPGGRKPPQPVVPLVDRLSHQVAIPRDGGLTGRKRQIEWFMTPNPEESFGDGSASDAITGGGPVGACARRIGVREGAAVILARMKGRGGWGWRRIVLVTITLLVVNVPFVLHQWQMHRAKSDGVHVSASVASVSISGDSAVVAFRLPKNVDSAQDLRTIKVDRTTGAAGARSQQLDVQVLNGNPDVFYVDGQVRSWGPLLITAIADLLILILLLMSWRLGGRLRRPPLEAVAVADVEGGEEGSLLDKQDDGTYLINGEVAETRDTSLVLRLRDRDVTVHLREHHNPLSVGERAQVRALLVG